MKVVIRETGKQETLELIDRKTGVNYVVDMIGNFDGLGNKDHQFALGDDGVYRASEETFDWWSNTLDLHQQLEDRKAELIEEHGLDAVEEALRGIDYMDLDDEAKAMLAALDEAFSGN